MQIENKWTVANVIQVVVLVVGVASFNLSLSNGLSSAKEKIESLKAQVLELANQITSRTEPIEIRVRGLENARAVLERRVDELEKDAEASERKR